MPSRNAAPFAAAACETPRCLTGSDATEHVTACPLDCPDTCSLTVSVTDGRITKVDAAPGNPLTDGYICQKVKHHARRVYARACPHAAAPHRAEGRG